MIKVMIIDDSALVRELIRALLANHPEIGTVNVASDPLFALARMRQDWPDVIILDVETRRIDGISFLQQLMQERPTPVIVCSSLTANSAEHTMRALNAGAVSVFSKPALGVADFLRESAAELVAAVRTAAAANARRLRPLTVAPKLSADAVLAAPSRKVPLARTTERLVAIGTSTGGTQALEYLLPALPKSSPALVVVQHMPEHFTYGFAERLNGLCEIEVKQAASGDRLEPGRALIAPGGRHLIVKRIGTRYSVEVVDGPPVSRHRPSADVLFRSVARAAGPNALGVIMTGMGDDGARGLKEMHTAGARTIAQDEESCVIFGMPKEAIKLGAVDEIVSLRAIPHLIARF